MIVTTIFNIPHLDAANNMKYVKTVIILCRYYVMLTYKQVEKRIVATNTDRVEQRFILVGFHTIILIRFNS